MQEKLLSTKDLSAILGVSVDTVKHWRVDGTGPAYIKIGRTVRYRPQVIEEWLDNKVVSTCTI